MFRERALIRSAEPEPLDDPTQVTAPHEWILVAALAAILAGVLAWTVFGTVERTVVGDCVLLRSGDRHAVLSAVSGSVSEVHVGVGDTLRAGAVLARVRMLDIEWQVRVARARAAALEEQAAKADALTAARLREALTEARAELIELGALEAAGGIIVSPVTGELTEFNLVLGQAVSAGMPVAEVRTGGNVLTAETLLPPDRARRIEPGMAARVALTGPGQASSQALDAEVSHVSPMAVQPPRWLSTIRRGLEGDGHVVRLTIEEQEGGPAPDGTPCRVEIVLGRNTPLGLLAARAGGGR